MVVRPVAELGEVALEGLPIMPRAISRQTLCRDAVCQRCLQAQLMLDRLQAIPPG